MVVATGFFSSPSDVSVASITGICTKGETSQSSKLGKLDEDLSAELSIVQSSQHKTDEHPRLANKQAASGDAILSSEGEGIDTQLAWVAGSPTYAKSIRSSDIRVHSYSSVKTYLPAFRTSGDILFRVDEVTPLLVATNLTTSRS